MLSIAIWSTSATSPRASTSRSRRAPTQPRTAFTFTIQGAGANALGGGGGGLGYYGINPSVAIKFDLYNNSGEGVDSTGIYTDGVYPDVPAIDLTGTGIDLHSGDVFNVAMTYDGSTLNVTITDIATSASGQPVVQREHPRDHRQQAAATWASREGRAGCPRSRTSRTGPSPRSESYISTGKFESINNFVAPTSGWYYAEVGGNPGTSYSLVATQGADFDPARQQLRECPEPRRRGSVLGAIMKGSGLFTLDDTLYYPALPDLSDQYDDRRLRPGYSVALDRGRTTRSAKTWRTTAPTSTSTTGRSSAPTPFTRSIPSTGAIISQGQPIGDPGFGLNFMGLAYLNGDLYAFDLYGDGYVIDPNTVPVVRTFFTAGRV